MPCSQIGPFEVPPGAEKAKIKIKVRMNLHGLISIEGVDNFVEAEEEVREGHKCFRGQGSGGLWKARSVFGDPRAATPLVVSVLGGSWHSSAIAAQTLHAPCR